MGDKIKHNVYRYYNSFDNHATIFIEDTFDVEYVG